MGIATNVSWLIMFRRLIYVVTLASVVFSVATAEAACALSDPTIGTVAEIVDGDTLVLKDGSRLRLIGAKPPRRPLGWKGSGWPMEAAAKDALTKLAMGASVELRYGGRRTDRYGNLLAHAFLLQDDRRVWLQGELVARGLARAYSLPDNRACWPELLAAERQARAARRGLWRSEAFRVRDTGDVAGLRRLRFSFQLVEGVVRDVGESRRRIYLNFSEDWRSDFTVSVAPRDRRSFEAAGVDLKQLAGKRIRVRGWIDYRNGPAIEATHPEQIELLDGQEAPADAKSPAQTPGSLDL